MVSYGSIFGNEIIKVNIESQTGDSPLNASTVQTYMRQKNVFHLSLFLPLTSNVLFQLKIHRQLPHQVWHGMLVQTHPSSAFITVLIET